MEIEGIVNEYIFTFKVGNAKVERYQRQEGYADKKRPKPIFTR
jgi:hypothetical protein